MNPQSHEQPPELPAHTRALLDAVIAISTDLDLHSVLHRIVTSARWLTGARYGAMGVIGSNGRLVDLITSHADDQGPELGDPLPFGPGVLAVPLRVRGTLFGNLYLSDQADRDQFTAQDEALVVGLASAAGLVIESARAYGISEGRRRLLEASAELAASLQPPVDLTAALQQITHSARRLVGAVAAAMVQVPDRDNATLAASVGLDDSLSEKLLHEVAGSTTDITHADVPVELSVGGYDALVLPLRANLVVPGFLVTVHQGMPQAHAGQELELLTAFADQAGLALDRALAFLEREELAVVTERDRIARDLHDVVIQRLFATGLQLEGLRAVVPEQLAGRVDATIDQLDLTIKQIRSTIFALQS